MLSAHQLLEPLQLSKHLLMLCLLLQKFHHILAVKRRLHDGALEQTSANILEWREVWLLQVVRRERAKH